MEFMLRLSGAEGEHIRFIVEPQQYFEGCFTPLLITISNDSFGLQCCSAMFPSLDPSMHSPFGALPPSVYHFIYVYVDAEKMSIRVNGLCVIDIRKNDCKSWIDNCKESRCHKASVSCVSYTDWSSDKRRDDSDCSKLKSFKIRSN